MEIDNQVVNSEAKKRWIKMVQKQLIRENPSALPNYGVDGHYGPETTDWVQRFQERKGLQVDGVAGPETLRRLRADIVQRPDSSGNGVEILQEDLLFSTFNKALWMETMVREQRKVCVIFNS